MSGEAWAVRLGQRRGQGMDRPASCRLSNTWYRRVHDGRSAEEETKRRGQGEIVGRLLGDCGETGGDCVVDDNLIPTLGVRLAGHRNLFFGL